MRSDPSVDPNPKGLTASPSKADHAQLEHAVSLTQDHRAARVVLTRVLAPALRIIGAELAGRNAGVEASAADGIIHGQQRGLLEGIGLRGGKAQGSPTHNVHVLVVEVAFSKGNVFILIFLIIFFEI